MVERSEGPAPLPAGLRTDWPAPWQPIRGSDDRLVRHVEHVLVNAALGLTGRLPEPLLGALLGTLARVAARLDSRRTAAAERFLRQALGDLPDADLRRRVRLAYRHLFRVAVDAARFHRRVPSARIREHFDVRMPEDVRRVRDSDRGCVLVTGHIGSWEAGASIVPWLGFDPVYVVAKPPRSRPLSRSLQRSRELGGVRVLPRRGAMQAAPAIVEAGGTLCMLLDQRARKRPVLAPFFGRPARCDRSAGVLIRRLRVPVLVTACYLEPEPLHYRVEFFDLLRPEEFSGSDPAAIATRINRALEKVILACPEQYLWLHDRYRDTPASLEEVEGAEDAVEGEEPELPDRTLRPARPVSSNAPDTSPERGATP